MREREILLETFAHECTKTAMWMLNVLMDTVSHPLKVNNLFWSWEYKGLWWIGKGIGIITVELE